MNSLMPDFSHQYATFARAHANLTVVEVPVASESNAEPCSRFCAVASGGILRFVTPELELVADFFACFPLPRPAVGGAHLNLLLDAIEAAI